MQLKTLLSATAVRQIIGTLDRTVENIAYDSRRVQRNGMFVALRGEKSDGHEFIGQAIEKGASRCSCDHEKLFRIQDEALHGTRESEKKAQTNSNCKY